MESRIPRLNRRQLTTAIAVVAVMLFGVWNLFVPMRWGNDVFWKVNVAPGQGLSRIAMMLKDEGLIRSRWTFILYISVFGAQDQLKAGTYEFSRGMNMFHIAEALVRGDSVPNDIEVFIPEGFNIWEIDKRLAGQGLIEEGELARLYPYKEGRLFPDTYRFAPGTPLEEIVRVMETNFITKAALKSDITIIIASMLEKEARTAEDMGLVSGIIAKRMKLGMPLQIDATVAYGWCLKQFAKRPTKDCNVTQAPIASELKIDGPYNTYARIGLPVAAISNPGITALKAAANPKPSDYLYYLSTRDGSQIIYSKTGAEHMRNRAKYLGL